MCILSGNIGGIAIKENNTEVPKKLKTELANDLAIPLLSIHWKELRRVS